MTLQEIKNLPNGTRVYHKADDQTIFTKDDEGIMCNWKNIDIRVMPWGIVKMSLRQWYLKPEKKTTLQEKDLREKLQSLKNPNPPIPLTPTQSFQRIKSSSKYSTNDCVYNIYANKEKLYHDDVKNVEQGLKSLELIKEKSQALYTQRKEIAQEFKSWCQENDALECSENMSTWFLSIKLKEWLNLKSKKGNKKNERS